MTKFFIKLSTLDRRYIFLIMALAVIIPLLFPMKLEVRVTPESQKVFDLVEELQPGDVFLLDMDYGPDTMAELEPMAFAIMRHAYKRGARIVVVCLSAQGVSLVESEIRKIAEEEGKEYGIDYTYLGYRPYPAAVILSLGQDVRQSFPIDYYGTDMDELPMMQEIKNYNDFKFVVSVSATSAVDYWIMYGKERYNFRFAIGVTAVMAADYYNYLNSGQILGILGGLKGAAEYETLLGDGERATIWMNIQSICHFVIVAFIIIGNIAFLVSRRENQ